MVGKLKPCRVEKEHCEHWQNGEECCVCGKPPENKEPLTRVDPVKQQLAEALKLAYKEMCEMGDIMNGMDIVFPEDVKRATPAFDSARAALAAYDEESKTS